MEHVEDTDLHERLPVEALRDVFEEFRVRTAICFGSHVTGDVHHASDVDLAVELAGRRPGDEGYNDVFFDLYAAVSEALGSDDVDLLDVHSLSDSVGRVALRDGVLVVGDPDRVATLREQFERDGTRSPAERFDDAIERIDEHLA